LGWSFTFGESQMIPSGTSYWFKVRDEFSEIISDEKDMPKQSSPIKETIDCEIVGLTAGVSPNVTLKTLVIIEGGK
jgi:hypothetical protein